MKAIFLDRATIDSTVDLSAIERVVEQLKCHATTSANLVVERAKDFEIIITNKVIIDESIIQQLPNLKLVCVAATGTNNIDMQAAKTAGIVVKNVVDYSTRSVAQHVFAYLLDHFSQVTLYRSKNNTNRWPDSQLFCQFFLPVNELTNMTLGIVGYGNIGKAVAKIAEAFGMQIIIAERPGADVIRQGRMPIDEVLAKADVLTLHCPLTEETENLFNEPRIAKMKPTSVLVNTSRGPVVDSDALASALKNKTISHAIVDVLEQEPPSKNHPLVDPSIENITLTHHIAWGSLQAQQKLVDEIANNIQSHF